MNHREYFENLAFECACEKEHRDEDKRNRADLDYEEERSVSEHDNK